MQNMFLVHINILVLTFTSSFIPEELKGDINLLLKLGNNLWFAVVSTELSRKFILLQQNTFPVGYLRTMANNKLFS